MSESYILTLINYSRVPFIHLDMQPLCWISCTLLETKIIPALLSWSISCILELTIQVNFLYIICKISLNSFCKTTFKFFLSLFVLKVCVIMRSINYLSSFYHILKCLTSSIPCLNDLSTTVLRFSIFSIWSVSLKNTFQLLHSENQ